MRLSTQFTAVMVALVLLTAAAFGVISYRSIESSALPRALERFDLAAQLLATRLAASVNSARGDLVAFRAAPGVAALIRASPDTGGQILDGVSQNNLRRLVGGRFASDLAAKPLYSEFRVIGASGREIVRVDRSSPDGPIKIAAEGDLRRLGDLDFFRETIALRDGEIYVSPVKLRRDLGAIAVPHQPEMQVATPLFSTDGRPIGVLAITVDMRESFRQIRTLGEKFGAIYVVNEAGDYLMHPDPGRAFAFEFGRSARIQDDYVAAAAMLNGDRAPRIVRDRDGARFSLTLATVALVDGRNISVANTVPYSKILPTQEVLDSSLLVALAAVIGAILLAALLARRLTRPLAQMTSAIEGLRRGNTMAVPTGDGGEIGMLAHAFQDMAKDVTEKSSALQRNAEIFDTIMTSMSDAVLLIDQDTRVVFANPAAKVMLPSRGEPGWGNWGEGYRLYDSTGITPIAPDQLPILRAARGEVLNNLEVAFHEGDSGRLQHHIVSARPIRGSDREPRGAVMVVRDITSNKETERQLGQSQKMDAIGQLTGGVAHDFNNILTVIIGTIEILAHGVSDRPQLVAIANMIDEAATRGADLTNHLLAFARKQPLQPRSTDVNTLIVDTARLLRPTLGEQIEIEAMLPDDAWRAMIDPVQLSTAIINLAVNARDAMPDGGKLTLETGNVMLDEAYAKANGDVTPGPYVMIAVSDTGVGIPAAIRDRVFEPFFTTKEVGKGTGLGLSMVYGFVKQSHGHIKIYSEEGHGTSIKLYLPRLEETMASTAGPAETPALLGGEERILVVEDDGMVRNYVVAQLSSLGYQTLSAANAIEALALLDKGEAFDLLFTDVIMPGGLNGRQLADEVLRRRPTVKVLFTSGYTENAIVHHGRLDHGVALLNKPYRKADLAYKIREVLGASRPGA
jgi:signal transduction histidine kinase/CheY-like chemotaxis protein